MAQERIPLAGRRESLRLLACLLGVALLAGCNSTGIAQNAEGSGSLVAESSGTTRADGTTAKCFVGPSDDELAEQILSLINIERAAIGVSPVTMNPELTTAAERYACTMAATDFFAHIDPETGEGPGDRAAEVGYQYFAVGENLAGGQTTAAEAVDGWMESPLHRDNLLSPAWTETGIGVRRGGSLRIYWVQMFGQPVDYDDSVAGVHSGDCPATASE